MATFKEAVKSCRSFRHNGNGPWMRYDESTGKLKRADGAACTHQDLITTFLALSDKWEIEEPAKTLTYWRAALIWDRNRRSYRTSREYFRSQDDAIKKLHSAAVVVKWESTDFPNLELSYPPLY